jgi:hypothetical protein
VPDFGVHPIDQVMGRQAMGTLYALQDQQSPPRMLLAMAPPDDLWNSTRRRACQSAFIARYDYQRFMAQQSVYWAKIFDLQALENDAAFCVMERFDWPVSRLIQLHLRPTPADLYALVTTVLTALEETQKLTARTHGNLRAEHILASSGSLADAHIVLAHPLASVFHASQACSDDLLQLGRIICELLAARRWTPSTPLDSGMTEFRSLGSQGKLWSEFCGFLLNKDLPADQRNIAIALERTARLKPRKSRKPVYAGLAAAILVLIIAGLGYIRHVHTIAEMSRFNGAYSPYAAAYSNWFKSFVADRQALAKVREFAPLSAALKKGIVLNPDDILHEFTGLLSSQQIQKDLTDHPHEAQTLGHAIVLLMRTERILGQLYPRLQKQQSLWQQRHWTAAAGSLGSHVLSAMPRDNSLVPFLKLYKTSWSLHANLRHFSPSSGGQTVTQWLEQLAASRQVARTWPALSTHLKQFTGTQKPVLDAFPHYAAHYLAISSDPMVLEHHARQLLTVAIRESKAFAAYGKQIRWDLVAQLPKRSMNLTPARYFPDLAGYRRLPKAENAYMLSKTQFDLQAAQVHQRIIHALHLPKPPTVNYQAKLEALQKQLASVANDDLWIWKNRRRINQTVTTAQQRLAALNQTVTAFIDSQINIKKWVAEFLGFEPPGQHFPVNARSLEISNNAAVNAAYLKKIAAIIFAPAAGPAVTLGSNQSSFNLLTANLRKRRWQVPDISKQIQTVKKNLTALITRDFSATITTSLHRFHRPWNKQAVSKALLPARAHALQQAMAGLKWTALKPVVPPAIAANWTRQRSAFQRLLTDINAIDDNLAQCRLPDDQIPKSTTIARLYAAARSNRWWHNTGLQTILKSRIAVLRQLAAIHSATADALPGDYTLALSAHENKALFVRAIWHRLGTVPMGTASLLPLERQIPAALDRLIQADARIGPARKRLLLDTLSRRYPVRWQQRINAAGDSAAVAQTIQAAADYRVTLARTPQIDDLAALTALTAQARFNILVYQFSRESAGVKTPLKAQNLASGMHQLLQQALTEPAWRAMKGNAELAAFDKGLQGIMKANPAQAQRPSGPALAGWKQAKAPGHMRIFTSPSGTNTLKFVLINPNGIKRFYLCTTELSVGEFINAVNSSHNLIKKPSNSFYSLIKPNGNYFGPHTWVYSQNAGQVELAKHWFTNTNQIYNAPRYPASLATKAGRLNAAAGGPPTLHDPVQYLPPQAAVYVAALLGCRLPTANEWRYAYQADGNQYLAEAHLAGKTLAAYVAYIKAVNSSRDARLPTPRYWDLYNYAAPSLAPFLHKYGTNANPLLWFAPVDSGTVKKTFIHLVGNVAEYVLNDPAYHKTLNGWIKNPATFNSQAITRLISPAALAEVQIIGGSCLAPLGSVSPATPVTVNWHLRRASRGFADVGIRLAYDPRVLTPQQRLAVLLKRDWYNYGRK